jgi:RNA polymerase sigma-70 factor (ECF subfamily)
MPNLISALFSASDEQLMWRVKLQDDAEAFASLMSRWQRPIENLCIRMTGDLHRAEDLAQTAFARIFAKRADWEPTGKFSTFLWRVALNLCHDELRRAKRRGECSLDVLDEVGDSQPDFIASEEPAPDEQADSRERAELVRNALLKLATHYREVVVLRHYEELKFHEIGEVLAIPEGTVKSRMAEALTQLNRLLKHLNGDTSCNPRTQTPELLAL